SRRAIWNFSRLADGFTFRFQNFWFMGLCESIYPSQTNGRMFRGFSVLLFLLVCTRPFVPVAFGADEQPFGIDHRIPWTTSRVIGSPDPPLPYTVEKTFTKIKWKAPVFIASEPDSDWLLVVQQGGEKEKPSKILRGLDDPNADDAETFLEL